MYIYLYVWYQSKVELTYVQSEKKICDQNNNVKRNSRQFFIVQLFRRKLIKTLRIQNIRCLLFVLYERKPDLLAEYEAV